MSTIYRVGLHLLGLLFVTVTPLSAQLFWSSHKVPQELQFQSLFEDSKGFIWLGDLGRVHRFDGASWNSYSFKDSSNSVVLSFAERANGELWVGLENGDIFFQQKNKWEKFSPEEGTPKKPIRSLFFDQGDKLWMSTYGEGLYYFSKGRLYNIDADDGLPSDDLYDAVLDSDSRFWCATDRGLGITWLEKGQKKFDNLGKKEGLSDQICTSLTVGRNGDMLVGMYDGSFAHISKADRKINQQLKCSNAPIKQILDDGSNTWVLDQEGFLWKHKDQKLIQIETPALVKHVYLCKQKRLWIIDTKSNIYSAPTYISNEGSLPDIPHAIAYDPSGKLWVGSTGGLFCYHRNKKSWESIPNDIKLNIESLYVDYLGKIWIGTLDQGLWIFDPKSKKFSFQPLYGKTSKDPILSISGNQKDLWIATFGGAYHCKLSGNGQIISQKHFQEADGLDINYIYQTLTDNSGNTFLATDGHGLVLWKNNELHVDHILSETSILSISQDTDGALWLLGDNGEVLYKGLLQIDTLLTFKDQKPLAIHAISPQRALLIYEKELYILDRINKQMIPLLAEKQFPGLGSQLNVITQGKGGEIWLGSPNGLLKLDLNQIPDFLGPRPNIKNLRINLQEHAINTTSFSYEENHLSFEYAGLWYQEPQRLMYKHRLKGHDLDWIESRDQQVIYPNLDPGEYTFELQTGIDGFYSLDDSLKYSFRIEKPFWQNLFFLLPFFIGMALVIALIVRYRESRIKYAQQLLRQNIEHQFETLRTQINPHFLFNAFSTLSDLVEEHPKQALTYIDRLSDMFRDTLRFKDQPLILLEEELEVLDNYYLLQKERYGSNFKLETSICPSVLDKKVPPLVLQILVENTLRHNIASKDHPLGVKIFSEENKIIVQNHLQLRSSVSKSTSIGLQNIRERYLLLTDKQVEIIQDQRYYTVKLPLIN